MVYPSLIAAVSDASHATWRARSLSVYRFWRDLGYARALGAGLIADAFGLATAIGAVGVLTFLSGVISRPHAGNSRASLTRASEGCMLGIRFEQRGSRAGPRRWPNMF
jgi:hypothetical protein